MGAMKDWAMTHSECPMCGKCFLPWEAKHDMQDKRLATCSQNCELELTKAQNECADYQEDTWKQETNKAQKD